MAVIPIDLDDFDTDDDGPLVPINSDALHANANRALVKEESPLPGPDNDDGDNEPAVESSKCEGNEDQGALKVAEEASKLLTNEQRLCIIKVLSESSKPDETMAKLRDAAISSQPCFGMEPLSLEQTAEGIRAWELETLPCVTELNLPWVYPGRKARIPNRRIQTSFFCTESRTVLVGESTALALRCHAHPDDVVETAATGHIRLPVLPEDFVLYIKPEVVYNGLLSSPQLESVAYAARRFTQKLPDGSVQGYCLGDGTGCGKGRIIAALIIHLWNHGIRRHVWISVSKDLIQDAKRDLKDLLAAEIPVFDITDGTKDGVAFSTYALLGRRQGQEDGLKDFFDFFGRDGGGLLCFDEAHKAKNLQINSSTNSGKKKGKKQGSKSALAVEELQRLLPNAKVLYSSATAATEICHMGYMTRLGLWGPKKSFANFKIFENNIAGGGVAAMEMLAVNMKAMGMLSCRSLAYTGISFEVIHTQILPRQKEMYDGSVEVFRELKSLLKVYVSSPNSPVTKAYLHKKKALFWMSYFYSVQQRFFKQLLVAFKVDEAVKLAQMALAENNQVVMSMWGTGSARLDAKLKETEKQRKDDGMSPTDHEDLLSGPELTLEHAIEQLILPLNDAMKKQQTDLIAKVKSLKLPANALDDLIDKLGGPDKVAEMSGRSSRLLRNKDDANGQYQYVPRAAGRDSSGEGINLMEQRNFQNGTKRVAIITEAASTGISLHADNRIKNKRRRLMITLELPWGADKAIQQFGRVHRSNQHVPPRFKIVLTPVGGEVRFASTIAQRLKWLGAMTKGDRTVGMGGDLGDKLADFDVHNVYGKRALSQFFQDLRSAPSDERKDLYEVAIQPHLGDEDYDIFSAKARSMLEFVDLNDSNDKKSFQKVDELVESASMNQFLNRILMFPISMQNAVFDCFMAVYDELVTKDKEAGEFSEAQVSLNQQLLNISLHEREHVHYDKSGAVSDLVTLQLDRGVTWETALKIYDVCTVSNGGDANEGFYHFYAHCSKIKEVCLIRQSPKRRTYEMITPHNGVKSSASANYITAAMLGNTALFRRVKDLEVAKAGWDWQRSIACDKCIHIQRGFKCVKGDDCKEGKRLLMVTLLSGAFLEVWGFLSQHISELSHRSKRNNTKALPLVSVRVDNRTIVGVRLAPESVEEVSYVLRNMHSDAEQTDEDTVLAIIALYKAEKIQSFSTWIGAHKALTPRVARSKEGLHSVKTTWSIMKSNQLIQDLVGGGTTCRLPSAEAYWLRRWGQAKEENVPRPVGVKPKFELPYYSLARPSLPAFGANECLAISDDDSVASAGSSPSRKVAKTEPTVEELRASMSPWETLQHLAQKRMTVKAKLEGDPACSAYDGVNKNQNAVKLEANHIDIDDGASSTSSTSTSSTSTSSGSSLVFISGNTGPAHPGADDTKSKENGLNTASNPPHAAKEVKEDNSTGKSVQSVDTKIQNDMTAEKLRKRMKKVQKLKKWMTQQGTEKWMHRMEKGASSRAAKKKVEEDRTPLNILSLADRRNLMREHTYSNMQSPKSRPDQCEDELLHMLYTPPKLGDDGTRGLDRPTPLDDPFALSDDFNSGFDTDTDISNGIFKEVYSEAALSDLESEVTIPAKAHVKSEVPPESSFETHPRSSASDSRAISSRGVKREFAEQDDAFIRDGKQKCRSVRHGTNQDVGPSTSVRGTWDPTTSNSLIGSGAPARGTKRPRGARGSPENGRAMDTREAWNFQMRRLEERERHLQAELNALKRARTMMSNGSTPLGGTILTDSHVPSKTRTVIERSFSFPTPNDKQQSDAASSSSKSGAMSPEPVSRAKQSNPNDPAMPAALVTKRLSDACTTGRTKMESGSNTPSSSSSSSSLPRPVRTGSLSPKVPLQRPRISEAVAATSVQKPFETQASYSRLLDAVGASTSSSSHDAPGGTQLKRAPHNNNNNNIRNRSRSSSTVKPHPNFSRLSQAVASSSSSYSASPDVSTNDRTAPLNITTRQLLREHKDAKHSKEAHHDVSRAVTSNGSSTVPIQLQNAWHPSHLTEAAIRNGATDPRSLSEPDSCVPTIPSSSSSQQASHVDQMPPAASLSQGNTLRERLERAKMTNHLKMLRGYLRQHDVKNFTDLVSTKTDFTQKHEERTLLHEAILAGNADAVANLLAVEGAARCMLNETDRTGARPLHAALRLPRPLKIVEVLMRHSPNLTVRDAYNRTALDIVHEIDGNHPESEALCALLNPRGAKQSSMSHGDGVTDPTFHSTSHMAQDAMQSPPSTLRPASSLVMHADSRTVEPTDSSLQQPHTVPAQQQDSCLPDNDKDPFDAMAAGYV